jgi:23S rRNA (cytosine1962-C5)-methyltransferase
MAVNKTKIILKPGREKSLLRHHPWVFSGAVGMVQGDLQPGESVSIFSSNGQFLAIAGFSPSSQIAARVWSWQQDEFPDENFLKQRLQRSVNLRQPLTEYTSAMRLAHAESDGLPGLVVDCYNDILVVQFLSWGAEYWRETILRLLPKITGVENIYERSDVEVRKLEGLPERQGVVAGVVPDSPITMHEHGLDFKVSIHGGQKTGFYLDQRANRMKLRSIAQGRQVLDCFCFSGGFSVSALKSGAESVTLIDSSAEALELARENLTINGFKPEFTEIVAADVFHQLRSYRDAGRQFDLVVLDPPKFAPTKKQVPQASRGYKDINLLAFKLLRSGGYLFTFSCSGGVDADLFQKIVAGAALDAGVEAQVVGRMEQDEDHPVALNFPEGNYLKGLICRIIA